MDQHYIEVLECLEPFGIGVYTNISPLLIKMFPLESKDNREEVSDLWGKIKALLVSLEGHIVINNNRAEHIYLGWFQPMGEPLFRWLDTIKIQAHITPEGLEFLNHLKSERQSHAVSRSVIETNKATTQLYRRQNRLYYVTLGIAVLSVVFPALSFFRDGKIDSLDSTIVLQQKALVRSRAEVKRLRQSYDSLYKVHNQAVQKNKR